jgi:hypothetical protein
MTKTQKEIIGILEAIELNLQDISKLTLKGIKRFTATDKQKNRLEQASDMINKLANVAQDTLTSAFTRLQVVSQYYKQSYSSIWLYNHYLHHLVDFSIRRGLTWRINNLIKKEEIIRWSEADWPLNIEFEQYHLESKKLPKLTTHQKKVMKLLYKLQETIIKVKSHFQREITDFNRHFTMIEATQTMGPVSDLLPLFANRVLTEYLPILKESFNQYSMSLYGSHEFENLKKTLNINKTFFMPQVMIGLDAATQSSFSNTSGLKYGQSNHPLAIEADINPAIKKRKRSFNAVNDESPPLKKPKPRPLLPLLKKI